MALLDGSRWFRARRRWLVLAGFASLLILFWPDSGAPQVEPDRFCSESVVCFPKDWSCDLQSLQRSLASADFLERVSKASALPLAEVQSGMAYQPELGPEGRVLRLRLLGTEVTPESARRLTEALVNELILGQQQEVSRGYDLLIQQSKKQLAGLQLQREQAYRALLRHSAVEADVRLLRDLRASLNFWERELQRCQLELLELPLQVGLEESLTGLESELARLSQQLEGQRLVFLDGAAPVQELLGRVERLQHLRLSQQRSRLESREAPLRLRCQRCQAEVERLSSRIVALEKRQVEAASDLGRSKLEQDWKALDILVFQLQFELFQVERERHRARREGGFVVLQRASTGVLLERQRPRKGWGRLRSALLSGIVLLVLTLGLWDVARRHFSLEDHILEQLGLPLLGSIPEAEENC